LIAERIDRLIAERVAAAMQKDLASGKENMSMTNPEKITREIGVRGTYCPGLMELISDLKTAEEGETIIVISCDPGCRIDIPLWVQESGNELLAVDNVEGGAVRFIVRKHIRR
jgi:TusA-related sulfurtransferase